MNSDKLAELKENGYVVIDLFDSEKSEKYLKEFNKWNESIVDKPIPPHGVISHYQIGHQPFTWSLRTEDKLIEAFKQAYETKDDLVVSFDGWGYIPSNLKRKDKDWFHIDQPPKRTEFACYQGQVAMTDNEERTFRCIPGSHKYFKDHFTEFPSKNPSSGFQKINFDFYISKGLEPKNIPLKRGQLLIWESRLVHCNRYGEAGETRVVAYVSYLPRSKATSAQLKKRIQAFENKRTTSHWAYPLKINSLQPQVYGDKSKLIDYDKLPKILYTEELLSKIKKIL